MNNMNVVIRAFFATLVVLSLAACCEKDQSIELTRVKSHNGQDTCFFRGGSSAVCITSFRRIQNSPEGANGKKISLKGFLAIRQGIPTLYATELDFLNDMVIESIVVRGERNTLEKLLELHAYSYVRVEGTFIASPAKPDFPWVGEISPSMISKVSHVERESVSDLLTNVKYLGERQE